MRAVNHDRLAGMDQPHLRLRLWIDKPVASGLQLANGSFHEGELIADIAVERSTQTRSHHLRFDPGDGRAQRCHESWRWVVAEKPPVRCELGYADVEHPSREP